MKITLVNRNRARAGTPAEIPLPIETPVLFESEGRRFWAQPAGRPPAAAVVAPLLPADIPCECRSVAGSEPPPIVRVSDDGAGRVDFFVGEEFAASYRYGGDAVRPHLNPIIGPDGVSVLRPPAEPGNPGGFDHIHHRGVWAAHGDVNGTDNWSEEPGCGRTVHRAFAGIVSGPVFGRVTAVSDWTDAAGRTILEEERTVTVYAADREARIIDQSIALRAPRETVFRDTKESGLLSVRVAPSMEASRGGSFENSWGGRNEEECWGRRAAWCDYSGPVGPGVAGIAVFDHPSNPRHPTWWHIRNYGLMTANFFGLSDFTGDPRTTGTLVLPAGETLRLTHRLFIHRGTAAEAGVRDQYLNFVRNPDIRLE